MNDPFTTAFTQIGSSLQQNLAGVATGQNSLFAPSVASLFGFNIQGLPLISSRDYFLTQMESWFTSIPLTTQWIVLINKYPACLTTSIIKGLERAETSQAFDIDRARSILTSYPFQKVVGCLFVQGVNIPNEEYAVDYINIENSRGFTAAPIVTQRNNPGQLTMDFLETNTSFTDFVIRPWVIAGSHFGYVARDPNDSSEKLKNVKTTVTVLQYTRTVQGVSMIPRKIWNFYNCAPISVADQSLSYDQEAFQGGRSYFSTKWAYSHYTVENNLYLPIATIINRIANGQLPSITTFQNGSFAGTNILNLI